MLTLLLRQRDVGTLLRSLTSWRCRDLYEQTVCDNASSRNIVRKTSAYSDTPKERCVMYIVFHGFSASSIFFNSFFEHWQAIRYSICGILLALQAFPFSSIIG